MCTSRFYPAVSFACLVISSATGAPLTDTTFTYQGRVMFDGVPLDGSADIAFALWTDAYSVNPNDHVGSMITLHAITVDKGLFTAQLDFGAAVFNGEMRWLEIAVRSPAGRGPFRVLRPRQPILPTPYAIQTRGIFVDELSHVGIGTTQPQAALHLAGGDTDTPVLRVVGSDGAAVVLASGDGGDHAEQGGAGALVEISAGKGGMHLDPGGYSGDGGSLSLRSGDGGSTNAGGGVAGSGGTLSLKAGDGGPGGGISGAGGSGGDVLIAAGDDGGGIYSGSGGDVVISAGSGEHGGDVTIVAGSASTAGNPIEGGDVVISGGEGPLSGIVRLSGGRGVAIGRDSLSNPDVYLDVAPACQIGSALPSGGITVASSGKVGIGSSVPVYQLDVNGDIGCIQLHETSDARLKSNVHTISNALQKIIALRGVYFDWKQQGHPDRAFTRKSQIGLIAQEVQRVLPEVVSRGDDGFYSVSYGRVVPVLVEAVKQLADSLDERAAQVRALEQRTAELDARLKRLEALLRTAAPESRGR